jgi:quercetin dioxygenase-like cupin family protein
MTKTWISLALGVLVIFAVATAQDKPEIIEAPTFVGFDSQPWQPCEGLAGCNFVSLKGDSSTGASQTMFRLKAGTPFPPHWHTSPDNYIGLQGELLFNLETGDTFTLGQGDFLAYPGGMIHSGACGENSDCIYYVFNNLPYDIHLVQ